MPKHMSAKALAANRANARKSTGPRTAAGKARSSQNAVTHGLLAQAVIPPSLARYEDPAEFTALLATLRREHAPVGVVEGYCVDTIAACHWRLGRLYRAEGAAIAEAQERAFTENERRVQRLAIAQADRAAIEAALASGDLDALRTTLDPEGAYPSCQGQGAVAMAQDQLQRAYTEIAEERVKDPETTCDLAALPDIHEALRFARYEAHLSHQLHHALATLDHLQRRRRGDGHSPLQGGGRNGDHPNASPSYSATLNEPNAPTRPEAATTNPFNPFPKSVDSPHNGAGLRRATLPPTRPSSPAAGEREGGTHTSPQGADEPSRSQALVRPQGFASPSPWGRETRSGGHSSPPPRLTTGAQAALRPAAAARKGAHNRDFTKRTHFRPGPTTHPPPAPVP